MFDSLLPLVMLRTVKDALESMCFILDVSGSTKLSRELRGLGLPFIYTLIYFAKTINLKLQLSLICD